MSWQIETSVERALTRPQSLQKALTKLLRCLTRATEEEIGALEDLETGEDVDVETWLRLREKSVWTRFAHCDAVSVAGERRPASSGRRCPSRKASHGICWGLLWSPPVYAAVESRLSTLEKPTGSPPDILP